MIYRGYSYKLYPSEEQERTFQNFAGVCRLVYNLALEQRTNFWRQYRDANSKGISYVTQNKELTLLRREFDWIADVAQVCQQQALRDLDQAFVRFFKGVSRFPKLRKKAKHNTFRFEGRHVKTRVLNSKWSEVLLPKIGWVRYRDTRKLVGKLTTVNVCRRTTGWFVSFGLSLPNELQQQANPPIGIDRGLVNTLALSNGELYSLPRHLKNLERKQRMFGKMVSRRKRGSKRYAKAKSRLAAVHSQMACIRRHWHHCTTHELSKRFGTIALEDLNIAGMSSSAKGTIEKPGKNVKAKSSLNRLILSQGWHLFEKLLGYKTEQRGGAVVKVPPHYTSQTCSKCGSVDKKSRKSQASFLCQSCGFMCHADVNAAKNILRRYTAISLVEEGNSSPLKREP